MLKKIQLKREGKKDLKNNLDKKDEKSLEKYSKKQSYKFNIFKKFFGNIVSLKISKKSIFLIGSFFGTIFGTIFGFLIFFNWDYIYWKYEAEEKLQEFNKVSEENKSNLIKIEDLKSKISSLETALNSISQGDIEDKIYKNEDFNFQFSYKIDEEVSEFQNFETEPFSVVVEKKSDKNKNLKIRVFGENSSTARDLILNYYTATECSSVPVLQKEIVSIGGSEKEIEKGVVFYKNCGPEKLSFTEVFYVFSISNQKFMVSGISENAIDMIYGILKTMK